MKFDDYIYSDNQNLSGYDPYSEDFDRDHWRRINDDWDFYRRQDEQWLTGYSTSIPQALPMVVPIDIPRDAYGDQSAQPILVRMITGGVMLALLGYLYWML